MIALFKSRKSAIVLIGLGLLFALSVINDYDVTKEIVTLIGLYITGNVAQKATRKEVEE
jgi:hypothetical protein